MATTGIAERIAYGRPIGIEDEADGPVHLVPRATTVMIARVLISAIFLIGGINKLTHVADTAGYMASAGLPSTHALAVIAGLAEVLGGIAILTGFLARLGALGLFVFLIPTTLVFHNFWDLQGMERQMQMVNFMKNLAVMGGLLLLFAHGPSRYSIDARIRRPLAP
jgi:putative oxidoreductase